MGSLDAERPPREGQLVAARFELAEVLSVSPSGWLFGAVDRRGGDALVLVVREPLPKPAAARKLALSLARKAGLVTHEALPHVRGVGDHEGRVFFAFDWVGGDALTHELSRAPLPAADVAAIGAALCGPLEALHHAELTHGAIDPALVRLARPSPGEDDVQPRPLVVWLGLGAAAWTQNLSRADRPEGADVEAATQELAPRMSPEECLDLPLRPSSDVYTLGLLLHELATGRLPFSGSAAEVAHAHRHAPLPPLPDTLSPSWKTVLSRCLGKLAEDRWERAADLGSLLERLAPHGEPPSLRPHPGAPLLSYRPTMPVASSPSPASARRAPVVAVLSAPPSAQGHVPPPSEPPTASPLDPEAEEPGPPTEPLVPPIVSYTPRDYASAALFGAAVGVIAYLLTR